MANFIYYKSSLIICCGGCKAWSNALGSGPSPLGVREFKSLPPHTCLISNRQGAAMEEQKKVGIGFGVMMLKDGKVLLGKRHNDVNKADSELRLVGTWTMPGGKLKYGESFEDGAKREVLEETGMILDRMKLICVNNDKNEYAHFVTIGMLAEGFSGEAKVMEPDEITEWGWFELDNLPKPLYFPSERILNNYFKGKFYIE